MSILDTLTAPMATDELKRQVEILRGSLEQKVNEEFDLSSKLNDVNLDLEAMNAKATYLMSVSGQLMELTTPPAATGWEARYAEDKARYYDPVQTAATVVGLAGLGVWFVGGALLPAGAKVGQFITYMFKYTQRSAKFAKLAESTKLKTMSKFGKVTMFVAAAASILEYAARLASAEKINAHLIERRTKFEEEVAKADRVLAGYAVRIAEAEALRAEMLAEAEVDSVFEYLGLVNEAIKAVAAQATTARMARNLLWMGQSSEQVMALIPGMDAAGIDALSKRLTAEIALVAGDAEAEVSALTGLTMIQIAILQRILAARGDAALGYTEAEIVERHNLAASVADLQIDLVDAALPKIWDDLAGDDDLSLAAHDALIPVQFLEHLRIEMRARGALWSGGSVLEVGALFPQIEKDRLIELAQSLQEAFAAPPTDKDDFVSFRLPVVAGPPEPDQQRA